MAALSKKCQVYSTLVSEIFERRAKRDHSTETLTLLGKMLKMNPDFYSLWNFRREILLSAYSDLPFAYSAVKFENPEALSIRDQELTVSADGIIRNPKSYGAWYHRVWIMRRFHNDFDKELQLCKSFLSQDQRNFHCWNYRRELLKQMEIEGTCPILSLVQNEFQFSEDKIRENFSNYSSFHHRSISLKRLVDEGASTLRVLLPAELSIVENAIFTEPDDQSAW